MVIWVVEWQLVAEFRSPEHPVPERRRAAEAAQRTRRSCEHAGRAKAAARTATARSAPAARGASSLRQCQSRRWLLAVSSGAALSLIYI